MAARRKSKRPAGVSHNQMVAMRTAVKMTCKICNVDLTAKPTQVPNPFDSERKPSTALRAPERVEIIFAFAGYTPARPQLRIALCDGCAGRVTFTSTGVPLMIDPGGQAVAATAEANSVKAAQTRLIAELQDVLARFGK